MVDILYVSQTIVMQLLNNFIYVTLALVIEDDT